MTTRDFSYIVIQAIGTKDKRTERTRELATAEKLDTAAGVMEAIRDVLIAKGVSQGGRQCSVEIVAKNYRGAQRFASVVELNQ